MADYYSLIKKAIARLDSNVPSQNRQALYERARSAQLTQLRSISPALSEAEIASEQLALEEAVRRAEAEAAHARDIQSPALDDLVTAAENIGKPLTRGDRRSSVVQVRSPTNSHFSDQPTITLPPMNFTGGATGRLVRYWRWRSLPPRRVA